MPFPNIFHFEFQSPLSVKDCCLMPILCRLLNLHITRGNNMKTKCQTKMSSISLPVDEQGARVSVGNLPEVESLFIGTTSYANNESSDAHNQDKPNDVPENSSVRSTTIHLQREKAKWSREECKLEYDCILCSVG